MVWYFSDIIRIKYMQSNDAMLVVARPLTCWMKEREIVIEESSSTLSEKFLFISCSLLWELVLVLILVVGLT